MAQPITEAMPPQSGIRGLASTLLERLTFTRRAGITYDGKRDLYETLGYKKELRVEDYRGRYERGGISERIMECFPNATWAGGAKIVEDDDPRDETEFEAAVREMFERLDVWAHLIKADILAGLGHYSIILLSDGGDNWAAPLPKGLKGQESILYINCFAEDRAEFAELIKKPSDPRFGRPALYRVKIGSGFNENVHWSRIIHVAEGVLEDQILGKPRLRACWNYLDDLDKIVGGGAEAAWRRMDPGMHFDVDPQIQLTPESTRKFQDEIEDYMHGLQRYMRTRGVKVTPLASNVAGFGPNSDSVLQMISATTGIPMRILTGSERGELASSQDRLNWQDRIDERRRGFATPLVRQLINRLIEHGALPKPNRKKPAAPQTRDRILTPEGYQIIWPDVGRIDDQKRAETVAKLASANQAQAACLEPPIILSNEIRRFLNLPPLPDTYTNGDKKPTRTVVETDPNGGGGKVVNPDDPSGADNVNPPNPPEAQVA